MPTKQRIFADRMMNIAVANGLVRMDLAVVAGEEKTAEGKRGLKVEATHQIVLPLDAFLAAVAMQEKFVKQLVDLEKARRETAAKMESAVAASPAG
jgi:hypothetical protein